MAPGYDGMSIFIPTILTITVSGVLCNIALMTSVLRQHALRTSPTFILLFSLSTDLCLLLVGLTHYARELIEYPNHSQIWCLLVCFFVSFSAASSVFHLVTFSVFRYLILTRPLWALTKITSKTSIFVCTAIWTFGLISSVPMIFISGMNNFTASDNHTVTKCSTRPEFAVTNLPTLFLGLVGSCGLMAGFHIAKTIKLRHNADMMEAEKSTSSHNVSNRAVAAIVLAFGLAWFPLFAIILVIYLPGIQLPAITYTLVWPFLEGLVFVNSAINPILYFFFSRSSRVSLFCNKNICK